MGKEEAERGVGRGEKERGWRIARLNHYSERKAKRRDQRRRRVVSLRGGRLGYAHLVGIHITCFFLILLGPRAAQMDLLGG